MLTGLAWSDFTTEMVGGGGDVSTDMVREQIAAFLKTETPEVLCVRGRWGTGKTYNWQTTIKHLKGKAETVALSQYAYVSLFGVGSINQIKAAILQNTVTRDKIGDLITSESVSVALSKGEKALKTGLMKLFAMGGESLFDVAVSGLSMLSTKEIICFDDLERKADGITAGDVLGFISYLKEERSCKVVLLLNDEALDGADKVQFASYLEKVVDINLLFAPTPGESADIALAGMQGFDKLKPLVRDRSVTLGIENVRVIRKIFRLVTLIEPLLTEYNDAVLETVITSIVLFGWCHYQPELAPALEYVRRKGAYDGILERKDKPPNPVEDAWDNTLREYGYGHTDDFDLVLMQGVLDGYFTPEGVNVHASALNKRVEASEAQKELQLAWDKYHYSFSDSQADVLDTLYTCFMKNVGFYNLGTLIGLVDLFRVLGEPIRGEEMFTRYAEVNKDAPTAFDTASMYQFGHEIPVDLRDRVDALREGDTTVPPIGKLLLQLEADGFHSRTADLLAQMPAEDYVEALYQYTGSDLARIRRGLVSYINVSDPGPVAEAIMDRAGIALLEIAKSSPFNDRRARLWGLIQRVEKLKRAANEARAARRFAEPTEVAIEVEQTAEIPQRKAASKARRRKR